MWINLSSYFFVEMSQRADRPTVEDALYITNSSRWILEFNWWEFIWSIFIEIVHFLWLFFWDDNCYLMFYIHYCLIEVEQFFYTIYSISNILIYIKCIFYIGEQENCSSFLDFLWFFITFYYQKLSFEIVVEVFWINYEINLSSVVKISILKQRGACENFLENTKTSEIHFCSEISTMNVYSLLATKVLSEQVI